MIGLNRIIGKTGAAAAGVAVLAFAVSMIVGLFVKSAFFSCFSSIFIAIGFLLFGCAAFAVNAKAQYRAAGFSGLVFASIYAVIVFWFTTPSARRSE